MSTEKQSGNLSDLKQCYNYMSRIIDIAEHEFPELSPAEIVFSLGLLQWRYYEHIEGFVRTRFPAAASPEATAPTDVN
jgi:hypothetical protein